MPSSTRWAASKLKLGSFSLRARLQRFTQGQLNEWREMILRMVSQSDKQHYGIPQQLTEKRQQQVEILLTFNALLLSSNGMVPYFWFPRKGDSKCVCIPHAMDQWPAVEDKSRWVDRHTRPVQWVLASSSVGTHASLTKCVHSAPAGHFTEMHWEAER